MELKHMTWGSDCPIFKNIEMGVHFKREAKKKATVQATTSANIVQMVRTKSFLRKMRK